MTTKVFRSGNSQAVRIPREFQFDVSEVEILRNGQDVVLRKAPRDLGPAFDLLASMSSDFLAKGRKQPKLQKRPRV